MAEQKKLPKEVQEIIKFYADFPHRNEGDLIMIFTGMIQELVPLFSDDLLPACITDQALSDVNVRIAKDLHSCRKIGRVDGILSREAILEILSNPNP